PSRTASSRTPSSCSGWSRGSSRSRRRSGSLRNDSFPGDLSSTFRLSSGQRLSGLLNVSRIHPEHLPVVPVGIQEAPAVHEAVVHRVGGVLASASHGLLH